MSEDRWGLQLEQARPRAMAALVRAFRDLDIAEEAFQEACLRALKAWTRQGLPKDPTAWLILVARNAGIDALRRHARSQELPDEPQLPADVDSERRWIEDLETRPYGDDLLRLFFVCCHPSLKAKDQISLALRVVAGLTVEEIARAFLMKPRALEQRLTRAKRRLGEAGVRYGTPSPEERGARLPAVISMIYLVFNEGYSASQGENHTRVALCEEAIRLARLLLRATPSEPEVMALLALCLLQHSRHRARLNPKGELILLEDQDRGLWLRELIDEGRVLVEKALRKGRVGPLQIQAAIAATHSIAESPGATDWAEIDRLYAYLEQLQPTPVVSLNRAVAIAKTRGPTAALEKIERVEDCLDGYFHLHGTKGLLLAELGRLDEARDELQKAAAVARTQAELRHIEDQLNRLEPHGRNT